MTKVEGMIKSENQRYDFDRAFWRSGTELVIREEPNDSRVYDLEERTGRFDEMVIEFAKTIPQNPVTNRIIAQLIGAGTSVGANYVEADDAVSKRDFLKSIGTFRKEARDEAFSTDGSSSSAKPESGSSKDLDGSEGTAFDFL